MTVTMMMTMKQISDIILDPGVVFFFLWALAMIGNVVGTRRLKKQYKRKVNELHIEAKGLMMRIEEKDRVIESLNKEVSRLNSKVKKDRLITTLEDLEDERALL